MNSTVFLMIASFLISFCTVLFLRVFLKRQLLDIPNERSSHTDPTPRGGGIGFIFAIIGVSLFFSSGWSSSLTTPGYLFLFALIPLALVGLIDDFSAVSPKFKFSFQCLAGLLVLVLLPEINPLNAPILVYLPFALLFFLTMANFYNFMDGIDGLVAGCALVQLIYLGFVFSSPLAWCFAAGVLGFLIWNWHPARIFMGDSGSNFLGGFVGICILTAPTFSEAFAASLVTAPLTLDALYTLIRRFLHGEKVTEAHRSHIYQRLNQSGFSHGTVSGIYIGVSVLIAAWLLLANGSTLASLGALAGLSLLIPFAEFVVLRRESLSLSSTGD